MERTAPAASGESGDAAVKFSGESEDAGKVDGQMSAAFELQPPQPKRDRRLDFEFGAETDNERLANLVTSYGVGTRSYNRSPEKRELDRQIETAKAAHANDAKQEFLAPLMCCCPQRIYPHELSVHELVRSESYNPRLRFRYPWSLCLSERMESSTEGRQNS